MKDEKVNVCKIPEMSYRQMLEFLRMNPNTMTNSDKERDC